MRNLDVYLTWFAFIDNGVTLIYVKKEWHPEFIVLCCSGNSLVPNRVSSGRHRLNQQV